MIFDFENITIGGEQIIKLSTIDGNVIWEKKQQPEQITDTIVDYADGRREIYKIVGELTSDNINVENAVSVVIGIDVTSIGWSVFLGNNSITSITIGDNVTDIGMETFERCRNLKEVIIGVSVKHIEYANFNECWNLETVTLPNAIEYIGTGAFFGCKRLTSIIYNGTIENWNAISKSDMYWKDGVPETCVVHCTDGDIPI